MFITGAIIVLFGVEISKEIIVRSIVSGVLVTFTGYAIAVVKTSWIMWKIRTGRITEEQIANLPEWVQKMFNNYKSTIIKNKRLHNAEIAKRDKRIAELERENIEKTAKLDLYNELISQEVQYLKDKDYDTGDKTDV